MAKHVIFAMAVFTALAGGAIAVHRLRELRQLTLKRELPAAPINNADLFLTRRFARELLFRCPYCVKRLDVARLAHVTREGFKRMASCPGCEYKASIPERFIKEPR